MYIYICETESLCCTAEINIVYQLFVVQSLSCVRLFAALWTAARQAPLSSTVSQTLFQFMSIESVMLSNHLILCHLLLLLPSVFPSIRVFFKKSALRIKWTKYWSFSLRNSPSNEYPGHFLLQGIFPGQRWNPHLLHWQADSWPLSHHQESPII